MLTNTYLSKKIYQALAVAIIVIVLSQTWPILYSIGIGLLLVLTCLIIFEWFYLRKKKKDILCSRRVAEKLSLSDLETISYQLANNSNADLNIEVFDELPYQLQHRQAVKKINLKAGETHDFDYTINPMERGVYAFGNINLFISNPLLGFLEYKVSIPAEYVAKVVPSIQQMRKYELQVFSKVSTQQGIRKIRKIGENDEFEHIRPFIQGDNIKSINWKATSRKNQLMINQFQNSRSQSVYCILDKGRSMKMPFGGLTLLDYAINSALTITNIILKKYDHAGLITFSDKIGKIVKSSSKPGQLETIAEALYNQKTRFDESNFELLYYTARQRITRRSIFLFFTNFETTHDMKRHLSLLRSLSKKHLLVCIIFINTEIIETSEKEAKVKSDIYLKTFAQKALVDKELIKEELIKNGIQTILTSPKNLSINVINKYLEIKAKRMR